MTSPFLQRHVGPSDAEQQRMLSDLGYADMAAFLADVVPADILDDTPPQDVLPPGCGEAETQR